LEPVTDGLTEVEDWGISAAPISASSTLSDCVSVKDESPDNIADMFAPMFASAFIESFMDLLFVCDILLSV
jgi:hypothetical protein